jgi:hypothetical protein
MWFKKSRYITNAVLDLFLEEYGKTPGILDVQDDGVRRDSIIVFFDNKKLPRKALPLHFMGFPLHLYDVRQMFRDTKHIVERIKVSKDIDLTDAQNQKVYDRFLLTLKLCETLLHPKKQKEQRSEVSSTA